jgi:uncharacterized protein
MANPDHPMTLRAQQLRAQAGAPPSPCNSVCTMSPDSGLCQGCFRTLAEIADWSLLSDADKRAVWARIGERAAGAVA